MYQFDRGSYRKQDSLLKMFFGSCLGKLVILVIILGLFSIVASITCPSEKSMRTEMIDNIRQCIERPDSVFSDDLDDALANVGYMFSYADSAVDYRQLETFNHYNRLEYCEHTFYSTISIYNNFHSAGERIGIGFLGMVIPTLRPSDILMHEPPIRKDYNKPVQEDVISDSIYMGTTPDLIFREDLDDYEVEDNSIF